jgi:putative endopeptidase
MPNDSECAWSVARRILLVASLCTLSLAASCGGHDGDTCTAGAEDCRCTGDGTCNPGLICQVELCVVNTRRDAGRSSGGSDDGDSGQGGAGGSPADASTNDALVSVTPPPPPIQVSYLDKTASPCDDFYQFACGGWQVQNALRPNELNRSTYGTPETDISKVVYGSIDFMIANRTTSTDPEVITIGNYYQSCMDAVAQPAARETLKTVVALVDPVAALPDLATASAELRKRGVSTFFLLYANPDPGATANYILTIDQGARQLPTRDYYFDADLQVVRDAYRAHITKLAQVVGVTIDADAVLRVETAIAQGELTPAQKRDPVTTYNKMPVADAMALASHFPWQAYFNAAGIATVDKVNVISPGALKGLDMVLTTLPIDDLKHYLRWQVVESKAALLDQPALDAEFEFHGKVIDGATALGSRRGTCLVRTRSRFAWELSRAYVEQYFPAGSRGVAQAMVRAIRAAFAKRIQSRPWLDDATRQEALTKLQAIGEHIGAPDPLPRITRAAPVRPPIDDNLAGSLSSFAGIVTALGQPVNRAVWHAGSEPIVVNAFYYSAYNDINIPAGILHLPHFDVGRSLVANFGGVGRIIGHELTHGFDDQGRHLDGTGSLREWWSPMVAAEFVKRAQCVGDQFGKFEAEPGHFIDPALTMGENLADLGGVRLAYEAFLTDGRSPAFEGFDDRQQFFIASAQTRCTNTAVDWQNKLLKTDGHSPDKARVNRIVAQMPEFAEAFTCPATAKERAVPLCEVW